MMRSCNRKDNREQHEFSEKQSQNSLWLEETNTGWCLTGHTCRLVESPRQSVTMENTQPPTFPGRRGSQISESDLPEAM